MITLVQLEYVVAVDTHRHFATAAKSCFVTQPTLSMQVKKMEDLLGVTIFDRSRQPVIPTDVGREIIDQARITIRNARKLNEIVKSHDEELSGELKIGILPTIAPYLLPRLINSFVKKHPKVSLKVKEIIAEEIVGELKKDLLDAGVMATPFYDNEILERSLFYEEIMVYTNPKHPLFKSDEVEAEQLLQPDLWLISDEHCFHSQTVKLCNYDSLHNGSSFSYQGSSLETLRKMVDTQGGFTLLPELAAAEVPEHQQNRIKHFDGEVPLREISLVTVRNLAKGRLLHALGHHIKKSVGQQMLGREKGYIVKWKG
ncbi:hydrogen peroxide-inducible genes activator [Flammeovirgaceae bacterium SG7u.111]|nr:hydrogen peroxide-inducible genes activator [Flammeovirgaceae bacterium SG7u.132]WPO37354.1 hydrogen peroxide-inducible genes activator [Flammeovirgaceae bacterium SG7u.111]